MRNFIIIVFIGLLTSCRFTLDTNIERVMSIHNYTNEAIYVQYSYHDSLQIKPKLVLFYFF